MTACRLLARHERDGLHVLHADEVLHRLAEMRARAEADDEPERRWIRSRFASRCSRCGRGWDVGDMIAWAQGLGALCEPCGEREERGR